MEFDKIVNSRYATKSFDGKKIPKEKVEKLFEIIRNAPSSFNIQPWKIKVVEDSTTKQKLSPASWNQPQITTCSHLLIFCADTDIAEKINELEKLMLENGAKQEDIKGYIEMMRNFENGMSPEKKLAWAQRQVYLALGNALNGAKFLGFDSCPMEGFGPEEYSKILNLPKNIVPTALCPIGYANDITKPKLRFKTKDVFI